MDTAKRRAVRIRSLPLTSLDVRVKNAHYQASNSQSDLLQKVFLEPFCSSAVLEAKEARP